MSDNCTIYCKKADLDELSNVVRIYFPTLAPNFWEFEPTAISAGSAASTLVARNHTSVWAVLVPTEAEECGKCLSTIGAVKWRAAASRT